MLQTFSQLYLLLLHVCWLGWTDSSCHGDQMPITHDLLVNTFGLSPPPPPPPPPPHPCLVRGLAFLCLDKNGAIQCTAIALVWFFLLDGSSSCCNSETNILFTGSSSQQRRWISICNKNNSNHQTVTLCLFVLFVVVVLSSSSSSSLHHGNLPITRNRNIRT